MTIKELCVYIHEWAKRKGFWDGDINDHPLKIHMRMVTEIAEATEQVRLGKPNVYYKGISPEGETVELADCVIRIMDYFESKGWDLEDTIKKKMAYNETRPYKHGKVC